MDTAEAPVVTAVVSTSPVASGVLTETAYDHLAPELHGFLARLVRDPEVAADLLSDTFTRLLVEERAGRWPIQTRGWLFRVASNLAMSRGRRLRVAQRAERLLFERGAGRTADGPEHEVLRRERNSDLDRALATLAPDARAGLLLAAQGFDGATIAFMLRRSEASTRTMMCRARMRLKGLLRENER